MRTIVIRSVESPIINANLRNQPKRPLLEIFIRREFYKNKVHSSHFTFKTSAIVIYFQKSPVERHSQQLNRKNVQKL